jgi:hypothetical protein
MEDADMTRKERRGGSRVRCGTAAAYVTHHRRSQPAVVTDISLTGLQLRGIELPPPGSWISVSIISPPHELSAVGHVRWRDDRRNAIGIELERGSKLHHHDLRGVMLALAFEAETPKRAALVIADDPAAAAQLCEPLRALGYVPVIATTPLDIAYRLSRERPHIEVAIVAGHPFEVTERELVEMIDEQHPGLRHIQVDDFAKLDETLAELGQRE